MTLPLPPCPSKLELRIIWRKRRQSLACAYPKAAMDLVDHLSNLPFGNIAGLKIAAYWPGGSEIDPRPLIKALEERGAIFGFPTVVKKDAPLVFRILRDSKALEPDTLSLPAPSADCEDMPRPDVVFLPLLAYDALGHRLGQGGGYYDRTLAALRKQGPLLAIGLAFSGQKSDACLPSEDHDQSLDGILTEQGYRSALLVT